MDPEANLREQLAIASVLAEYRIPPGYTSLDHAGAQLAQLVVALNEWRNSGGFTPAPVRHV